MGRDKRRLPKDQNESLLQCCLWWELVFCEPHELLYSYSLVYFSARLVSCRLQQLLVGGVVLYFGGSVNPVITGVSWSLV